MTSNTTAQDTKDPMKMMTGMMGGIMSSFIDPIRIGLQESVRRVTVRVSWDEPGRQNQTIEVVQYLTDPNKLQLIMGGGRATVPGGAPGTTPTGATQQPPGIPKLPGMFGGVASPDGSRAPPRRASPCSR